LGLIHEMPIRNGDLTKEYMEIGVSENGACPQLRHGETDDTVDLGVAS